MILFAENLVPHQLFFAVLVAFFQIRGLVSKKWVISHGLLYTKWEYFALETCLASNANSQSWRWHTFKDKKVCSFPQLTLATPCVASNITFLKTRTWFAIILWRGVVALPLFQNLTSLTFPGTDLTRNVYPTAPLSINCSRK